MYLLISLLASFAELEEFESSLEVEVLGMEEFASLTVLVYHISKLKF